ncbi:eukaryotic translation initiation factor 5B-like [Cornus florida]|uniref:eukaryotic translation initiation factor 5B-like n=1 Tax=Cornus florida TaxID=4283 RepID=UPI00289EC146|nr:eukaryotic translation initiation factor 5B-like [Cornus florida]XP_059648957.1 eukaryotic translation initiation factor 5B-like [Cornus florida]XP_059648959.1 eukaryotic translation initiation factor 5B-like [Cornus florida]XP_059648960.1 eukaryotic translation initiation factor 5B-like [Cornus florida]XP_059648961.1 eukaryotic translation initiation factor 5B-like [Cornus florida]XP_059648962.1 eukaryotic translation initiation factor 5B-like [Cornus florida]XP_059648963.1 eukaryotic tra
MSLLLDELIPRVAQLKQEKKQLEEIRNDVEERRKRMEECQNKIKEVKIESENRKQRRQEINEETKNLAGKLVEMKAGYTEMMDSKADPRTRYVELLEELRRLANGIKSGIDVTTKEQVDTVKDLEELTGVQITVNITPKKYDELRIHMNGMIVNVMSKEVVQAKRKPKEGVEPEPEPEPNEGVEPESSAERSKD